MTPTYTSYQALIKPSFAPPAWIFGPVWTILYIIIAISFCFVFYKASVQKIPRAVIIPFVLNLIFNFAFSPIQFGLQNNFLASIDILLVLGTIVWIFIVVYRRMRWVMYVNIPYFLWVSFATVLQLTITYLNW